MNDAGTTMWHMKQCIEHLEAKGVDLKQVPLSVYDPYTITSFTTEATNPAKVDDVMRCDDVDATVIGIKIEVHRKHLNSKERTHHARMFVGGFDTVNKCLESINFASTGVLLTMKNALALNMDCLKAKDGEQR